MEMTCLVCGHTLDVCLARQNADDAIATAHQEALDAMRVNAMLALGGRWLPNAFGMRIAPPRESETWVVQ